MENFMHFLEFAFMWLLLMGLIGLALWLTGKLFGKKDAKTVNPEEYAKNFEKELAEPTPEKPIKKFFRNPYVLSGEEIRETSEKVKDSEI